MKLLRDNIISKKDIIYPIILFLTAVIIFLNTTAPDVTTGDSGELLASAYSLGIGHPPGYPLYIILAKLFSYFAYLFYPLMLLSGRNIFDISDTRYIPGYFSREISASYFKNCLFRFAEDCCAGLAPEQNRRWSLSDMRSHKVKSSSGDISYGIEEK